MNAETLRAVMLDRISLDFARAMLPHYVAALQAAGCTTVNRAAMWGSQIGHESASLRYMEEIASGAAYENRRDLGNTQPGDGRRFKGRGPIQLTGRNNYGAFSRWCHGRGLVDRPDFFVLHPLDVATPRWGFLAAAWYWTVARTRINGLCDRGDLDGVTRQINGGLNGIKDRRMRWDHCLRLGDRLLPGAIPAPPPPPAPLAARPLGTELVMDPLAMTGVGSRRFFLDPPGAKVIEAAWVSLAVDGPDGAAATVKAWPQRPGGGTGDMKTMRAAVLTDGSHTSSRDPFQLPTGTDQVALQWEVTPGATAYLVPAFRAAK